MSIYVIDSQLMNLCQLMEIHALCDVCSVFIIYVNLCQTYELLRKDSYFKSCSRATMQQLSTFDNFIPTVFDFIAINANL